MRWLRSIRLQGVALLVVLVALPLLVLAVLGKADAERRALVLAAVSEAGAAIGTGLAAELESLTPAAIERLPATLARFARKDRTIRVLLRPADGSADGFFLLAAEPMLSPGDVDAARRELIELGVLPKAAGTCDAPGGEPVLLESGVEVMTAVVTVAGRAGCWAVVIGTSEARLRGVADPGPYWQRPEARAALAIYGLMAGLIALIFVSVWSALRRIQSLTRSESEHPGFARSTVVPELSAWAGAFDDMVSRLRRRAEMLRQAAEDNVHAFKGPIGTIRQALQPLRRHAGADAALAPVDTALARLDGLVHSASLLDSATAELLVPQHEDVDLSALVVNLVASYAAAQHASVVHAIAPGVFVRGQTEALETMAENLVENAVSFAAPGGQVLVTLARDRSEAVLRIEDDGPGVEAVDLPHIFERYYSHRPEQNDGSHFGLGLWLARQHVLALGGTIAASNRSPHGLSMEVRVPAV